jgi:haloalkane dehalogenase
VRPQQHIDAPACAGELLAGADRLARNRVSEEGAVSVISDVMPYEKRFVKVFDRSMAYIETGQGNPIVFLHGNPTSSYLWRNILPYLQRKGRCIAPDLIGMGDSEKLPRSGPGSYSFVEHRFYLDALLTSLDVEHNVTIIGHDWGSALGFDWASRHRGAVRGIAYMEAIVQPVTWEQWSPQTRSFFEKLRSPAGEQMILQENLFVESLLPRRVLRTLTDAEMEAYRRPYLEPGEGRRPTLSWPRQLPIEGDPAAVVGIVRSYAAWLAASAVPKLFVNAEPGTLSADERKFCRSWPNQTEVTVRGLHFIQEDSPDEIGKSVADWYTAIYRS